MMNDNKKNCKYFEDVDVLTNTFRYLSKLSKKDLSSTSFSDALVRGYAETFNVPFKDYKKIDNTVFGGYYICSLSLIFKRRCLTTLFREMKKGDLLNYEKIENSEYWQKIKQSILNSNKSINEKEFDVMVKTEFKNFLSEICNSITHNNEEKYFNLNQKHLGSKVFSATKNGINDAFAEFRVLDDEFLSLNLKYHSAKLNKTFDFNLSGGDVSNLIELCRYGINRTIGFALQYDDTKLPENLSVLDTSEYLIKNGAIKLTDVKTQKPIKEQLDEHELSSIMFLYNKFMQLNSIDLRKLNYEKSIDLYNDLLTYSYGVNSINPFGKIVKCYITLKNYYTFLPTILLMYNSVYDRKKHCFAPISVGTAFENNRRIFADTNLDETDQNGLFRAVEFDCQLIYYELLLTEILNLLEFIDSQQKNKELWKDLAETYEIFYELADKFSFHKKGASAIPETIRNSIIHVRYLLDDEKIHFYDGKNETQIKYQFSTTINQLEEIRDCVFEYVDNYLTQKETFNKVIQ